MLLRDGRTRHGPARGHVLGTESARRYWGQIHAGHRDCCILVAASILVQPVTTAPLGASPESISRTANVERGIVIARESCSECHTVERARTISPNPGAPSFERIANTPGMGDLALLAFLYTPHREMPNIVLTHQEADDIIAYIRSMRAPEPSPSR
jgi:mono/diheme cytochrome c family protein